jgi:PAS domain S-box-containing protein
MSRRPRTPRPAPHDYGPEIERLHLHLAAFMLRWQGGAAVPPAVAEAVEELTTTVEELQAMNEDLTQSQQAALESQRRYEELFEGVPEAYLVTAPQGLIEEANRPAAHLFNIDRAHLTGLPLAVFIAPDMRASFQAQLAWLRTGAEVREWVVDVQPRHRPTVTVVCRVAPAFDADGVLVGLRWLLRDLPNRPQVPETAKPRARDQTTALAHAQKDRQATPDRSELRVRELHHRVKNHLQALSSLLDWQGQDVEDPRARTVFEACQGRIRAMTLLHEHLYRAGDVERLELGDYLRRLALQTFAAYGIDRERITLTLQADAVDVGISTAVPCGLIVHEVLSNCLQHAFPDDRKGGVAITLQAGSPGRLTVTIRDTGVGAPVDVDLDREQSFSLHLVRALTDQLQGTLVVSRDQGTCVTLTFPV